MVPDPAVGSGAVVCSSGAAYGDSVADGHPERRTMTTLPGSPASDASAAGTADVCQDSPMIGLQVQDRDGVTVV